METNWGTTGTRRVGETHYSESLQRLIELPKAFNVPMVSVNLSPCTL